MPPTGSSERLAASTLLATRMRVNELFVTWLSSDEGADAIRVILDEQLAAARQPAPLDDLERQTSSTPTSAAASPMYSDPHTPSTPPPVRPAVRATAAPGPLHVGLGNGEATSPGRYLGVDEVEMYRSHSPGGASPVSPNHAVARAAMVDPHLPRSPEISSRMKQHSGPSATGRGFPMDSEASLAFGAGPAPSVSSQPSTSRAASPVGPPFHPGGPPRVATYEEIPRFNLLRKGQATALGAMQGTEQELRALNDIFSASAHSGTGTRRGSTSGGPVRAALDLTNGIKRAEFDSVCQEVFRVPAWLKTTVFRRALRSLSIPDQGPATLLKRNDVKKFYDSRIATLTPNRRLFEFIRSPDSRREHLTMEELANATKDLVANHAGLEFLTQAEFQELYCKTVAARIVYHLERRQSRVVEWVDFDHSELPQLMRSLDLVSDINQVLQYFSYEHFYVLYCRFWELDVDKNHRIGLNDLLNYSQGALTPRALERVVQGYGHRLSRPGSKELEFEDFVFFCLSEEDKNSIPAKRYWFNVIDLDADGVISGHEMEYFFEQQAARFEEIAGEELKYEDMLCQMLDMFVPHLKHRQGITFADIKDCPSAEHFFNMLVNAGKFWQFEHRDPFAEHQQRNLPERTAWDRFARSEYDRMAQEAAQ